MSSHASGTVLQMAVPVKQVAPVENVASSTSKVDTLANDIQLLKAELDVIRKTIAEKEAELLLICGHEEDGSSKFNTEHYTITTTGKLTRKITDADALAVLAPEVVRVKKELDTRKLEALATKNPMLYQKALGCIETKAAKPAIKIEPVEVV